MTPIASRAWSSRIWASRWLSHQGLTVTRRRSTHDREIGFIASPPRMGSLPAFSNPRTLVAPQTRKYRNKALLRSFSQSTHLPRLYSCHIIPRKKLQPTYVESCRPRAISRSSSRLTQVLGRLRGHYKVLCDVGRYRDARYL